MYYNTDVCTVGKARLVVCQELERCLRPVDPPASRNPIIEELRRESAVALTKGLA